MFLPNTDSRHNAEHDIFNLHESAKQHTERHSGIFICAKLRLELKYFGKYSFTSDKLEDFKLCSSFLDDCSILNMCKVPLSLDTISLLESLLKAKLYHALIYNIYLILLWYP